MAQHLGYDNIIVLNKTNGGQFTLSISDIFPIWWFEVNASEKLKV